MDDDGDGDAGDDADDEMMVMTTMMVAARILVLIMRKMPLASTMHVSITLTDKVVSCHAPVLARPV